MFNYFLDTLYVFLISFNCIFIDFECFSLVDAKYPCWSNGFQFESSSLRQRRMRLEMLDIISCSDTPRWAFFSHSCQKNS